MITDALIQEIMKYMFNFIPVQVSAREYAYLDISATLMCCLVCVCVSSLVRLRKLYFLVYNRKTYSLGLLPLLPVLNSHELPPLALHKLLPAVKQHLGLVPEGGLRSQINDSRLRVCTQKHLMWFS